MNLWSALMNILHSSIRENLGKAIQVLHEVTGNLDYFCPVVSFTGFITAKG